MTKSRSRSAHPMLLALEAEQTSARSGFACMFSTSDEYELAVINERRAQGRYGRPTSWPFALLAGCTVVIAAAALLWS